MLVRLKNLFTDLEQKIAPSQLRTHQDPKLAMAAIMVHLIAIDGRVKDGERTQLLEFLQQLFKTDQQQLARLVPQAVKHDHLTADVESHLRIIRVNFSMIEKEHLVESLWKCVYSESPAHEFAVGFVELVARRLELDVKLSDRMRGMAQKSSPHAGKAKST